MKDRPLCYLDLRSAGTPSAEKRLELAEAKLAAVEAIWVEASESLEAQINRAASHLQVGTARGLELCPRSALIYLERLLVRALDLDLESVRRVREHMEEATTRREALDAELARKQLDAMRRLMEERNAAVARAEKAEGQRDALAAVMRRCLDGQCTPGYAACRDALAKL